MAKKTSTTAIKSRRVGTATATRSSRQVPKTPKKRAPRKTIAGGAELVPPAPVVVAAPVTAEAPQREGLRAKMIAGVPEAGMAALEIAYFGDSATQVRGPTGLILGTGVVGEAVISYSPMRIPRVNNAKTVAIYVALMAETPSVEALIELRLLAADGIGLVLPAPLVTIIGMPVVRFPLPVERLGAILTAAIHVRTRSAGVRPIIRAAWVEVEG